MKPRLLLTLLLSAVAVALMVPVEISFLLTSYVFGGPGSQLVAAISSWLFPVMMVSNFDVYGWDWRILEMLLSTTVLIFAINRGRGAWKATFRTLCVMSLFVLQLPVFVFLFDHSEFNLYFAISLEGTPYAWFTNADLLVALASVLAVSSFALTTYGQRLGAQGTGQLKALAGPFTRRIGRIWRGNSPLLTAIACLVLVGASSFYLGTLARPPIQPNLLIDHARQIGSRLPLH